MSAPVLHLADGWIVQSSHLGVFLINILQGSRIRIGSPLDDTFKDVCIGSTFSGFEDFVPRFIADGVLREGEMGVDLLLAGKIRKLEQPFASTWLTSEHDELYSQMLHVHAWRKLYYGDFGQCPVFPETAVRRALLIGDAKNVGRKKIVCLGDDDLVSIALSTLGHEVTVIDIDPFLLKLIDKFEQQHDLKITTKQVNLLNETPVQLKNSADLVLLDPMSNRSFFKLFLTRAWEIAKPVGRIFTAVFPPAYLAFQESLTELGLTPKTTYRRHNRYYTVFIQRHTYESDWVEIQVPSQQPDPLNQPELTYAEEFFERGKLTCLTFSQIAQPKWLQSFYLEILAGVIACEANIETYKLSSQAYELGAVCACLHQNGAVILQSNFENKTLQVQLYPHKTSDKQVILECVLNTLKQDAEQAKVSVDNNALTHEMYVT